MKFKSIIDEYVIPYETAGGTAWRVCLPDGHGNQFRKRGFPSKGAAQEWALARFTQRLQNRGQIETVYSDKSFEQLGGEWLAWKRSDVRYATALRYESLLRQHLFPYFGSIKAKDLRKSHVRQFITDNVMTMRPKTMQLCIQVLKQVVKDLERDDIIGATGLRDARVPSAPSRKPAWWDPDQMNTFILSTRGEPHHLLWLIALTTALRAGEAAGLKWSNVELRDQPDKHLYGFIKICRTFEQKSRTVVELTKNGDDRMVPVLRPLWEVLRPLRDQNPDPETFVVGGSLTPLKTHHWARLVRTHAARHALPPLTFHQLRHSACSWLGAMDIPGSVVSSIMGHRDPTTTKRYTHVAPKVLEQAIANLDPKSYLRLVTQQDSSNVLAS